MNTLINVTLDPFVSILQRLGLLAQDLDYHIVRASMVIISCPSATRNGGHTRRKDSFPSSATAR